MSRYKGLVAVFVSGSLMFSSTAAVAASAPTPAPQINPWAALTAMSGGAPAAALCGATAATAAAAAAAGQAPAGGCVLPTLDGAPPVAQSGPPQPIPVPPVEPGGVGFGFNPLLLALGALAAAALIFLLVRDGDDDEEPNSAT
jgi:hypothetical protein